MAIQTCRCQCIPGGFGLPTTKHRRAFRSDGVEAFLKVVGGGRAVLMHADLASVLGSRGAVAEAADRKAVAADR